MDITGKATTLGALVGYLLAVAVIALMRRRAERRPATTTFAGAASADATARKARDSISGKSLPRLSARRRIPAQAFGVK